ncbi:uncharacterized protein LOC142609173 [Castanea sativa]|uniref:uncharacterized protein LOC142609173 n=1 Tax=Castanea sativa TaxID=21020 RepID=UPI003F64D87F
MGGSRALDKNHSVEMSKVSSGRTLSAVLGSLGYSSQTMDDNLTTPILENFIIKTRFEGAKEIWPDELPSVLWACRTTLRAHIGETSFKLAYGSDTMIPAEVGLTSYRVAHYKEKENKKSLCLSLNLIDEVRMDVEQRVAHYKNLMTKYHDALVKPRHFNIGYLVLKRVSLATKDPSHGKLGPNWEELCRVFNSKRRGSYY